MLYVKNNRMTNFYLCCFLILLSSCGINSHQDNPTKRSASNFNNLNIEIDSLRDPKHASYLSDLPLRQVATYFLNDSITPTDNTITFNCLDSLLNDNAETRSFYFPVYLKILERADGALAEVVGGYVIQYIERYPSEFFTRCIDLNSSQFELLCSAAGSDLYFEDDNVNYTQKWGNLLISNCLDCSPKQLELIQKFKTLVLDYVFKNND